MIKYKAMKKLLILLLLLFSFLFSFSQEKKPKKDKKVVKKQKIYIDNYKYIDDFTYPIILADSSVIHVYDFDKWEKYYKDSIPTHIKEQRRTIGNPNVKPGGRYYKKGE